MESIGDIIKPIQKAVESKIKVKEKWLRDGFAILPNSFVLDKKISPQAKALFLVLVAHAFVNGELFGEERSCHISHAWLKEELGVSQAWLSKYSKELIDVGVLKIIRTGRASDYEISFSVLDKRVDSVAEHLRKVRAGLRNKDEI
jgi:hypothetical protein